MVLYLEEDESFSLTANVLSPGYQSLVLKGYLVQRRGDGVYIAPLIPQLFYGASGEQLQTWRQWIPSAGSQVILSRSGGLPKVPREELWWRKVEEAPRAAAPAPSAVAPAQVAVPAWAFLGIPLAVGAVLLLASRR